MEIQSEILKFLWNDLNWIVFLSTKKREEANLKSWCSGKLLQMNGLQTDTLELIIGDTIVIRHPTPVQQVKKKHGIQNVLVSLDFSYFNT